MCFRPTSAGKIEAKCPKCGAVAVDGASVCESCGTELPKLPPLPGMPGKPGAPVPPPGMSAGPKVPPMPKAPGQA